MMQITRWTLFSIGTIALVACNPFAKKKEDGAAPTTSASAGVPAKVEATVAKPEAPTSVTFGSKVPPSGLKGKRARDFNMQLTVAGQVVRQTEHEVLKIDVKESDDFRITKAALDIDDLYETSQEGSGAEKKKVSPLSGFRFVVTRDDAGKLSALDAEGEKAAPAQTKLLQEKYKDLFEKDKVGEFLPKRAIQVGEKLTPSQAALLEMLGLKDDGSTSFDGVEFILRTVEKDEAHFDIDMTMTMKIAPGMRLRSRLLGKLGLQTKTTWPTGLELAGPVTVLDAQGTEKGKGNLKFKVDVNFGSP